MARLRGQEYRVFP
ncbi:hypothetical protein LINPERPRIM_LOCUS35661 [Linum perenne]